MAGDVEYLAEHGLPQVFDRLLTLLLRYKPADPCEFLRNTLLRFGATTNCIILFGPNGSGKGTQASLIQRHYPGMVHIESGAIFRNQVTAGSPLGRLAKGYMDRGELVPDDLTIPIVLKALKAACHHGWLLDGFPRTLSQAKKLWIALRDENLTVAHAVEIQVSRKTARDRILGRRVCGKDSTHVSHTAIPFLQTKGDRCPVCSGALVTRADDRDEAAITRRHDVYYDRSSGTLAAVQFFQDLAMQGFTNFFAVDGTVDVASVEQDLLRALRPSSVA